MPRYRSPARRRHESLSDDPRPTHRTSVLRDLPPPPPPHEPPQPHPPPRAATLPVRFVGQETRSRIQSDYNPFHGYPPPLPRLDDGVRHVEVVEPHIDEYAPERRHRHDRRHRGQSPVDSRAEYRGPTIEHYSSDYHTSDSSDDYRSRRKRRNSRRLRPIYIYNDENSFVSVGDEDRYGSIPVLRENTPCRLDAKM